MSHGLRATLAALALTLSTGASAVVTISPPPGPSAGYGAFTFSLARITSNSAEDLSDQLFLQVIGDINPGNGLDPTVYFKVWNRVGTPGSITYVAADQAGATSPYTFALHGQSAGVSFTLANPFPGNLPGGNSLNPSFSADWGLQRTSQGGVSNGINAVGEYLEFRTTPTNGDTYLQVAQNVWGGQLRFGLHVQAIGVDGRSDTYVTEAMGLPATPIPEPQTYALFAVGMALMGAKAALTKKRGDARGRLADLS